MIKNAVNMPKSFLLLLVLATFLLCECINAQLSIVKVLGGFKDGFLAVDTENVASNVDVTEGANLTLTCYFDNPSQRNNSKLVWGRKTKNLKFKNSEDFFNLVVTKLDYVLKVVSEQNNELLDTHSSEVKSFIPVKFEDQGTYFCMTTTAIARFKIIHIRVHDACPSNKFMCVVNRLCINSHYICDGRADCKDASDEAVSLCGSNPCKDKIPCSDNRCIPSGWCCNKRTERNCTVNVRPDCCPIIRDPYDPINYYEPKEVDDVNKVAQKGASRYIFVIVCVISGIFSFIIFLCIISRMCKLDSHRVQSHNNTLRFVGQQEICQHSECAIRRQISLNAPCFYTRQGEPHGVDDPLIISFSNVRNDSDNPPSYSEVVSTSMRSISKLGIDDDSITPPPPYSSTKFGNETENSNDNTCASINIEVNNSRNCDNTSTNATQLQ